jgi:hypothetical protein
MRRETPTLLDPLETASVTVQPMSVSVSTVSTQFRLKLEALYCLQNA